MTNKISKMWRIQKIRHFPEKNCACGNAPHPWGRFGFIFVCVLYHISFYIYIYIYMYIYTYPVFLLLYKKIAILSLHKKHAFLYIYKAFSYNYKGKSKIGVIHNKWDLNTQYQYKVDFLPKPWNDPMVHAVILVVGFCFKLTRKVAFSRKPMFDQNNKFEKTWNPDKTCPISTL